MDIQILKRHIYHQALRPLEAAYLARLEKNSKNPRAKKSRQKLANLCDIMQFIHPYYSWVYPLHLTVLNENICFRNFMEYEYAYYAIRCFHQDHNLTIEKVLKDIIFHLNHSRISDKIKHTKKYKNKILSLSTLAYENMDYKDKFNFAEKYKDLHKDITDNIKNELNNY